MTRKRDMWEQTFHPPRALALTCAAALFAMSPGIAQEIVKNPASADVSGAIIVPPVTDPGMIRQAPPSGDAQAVKPLPMPGDPDAVRRAAPGNAAHGQATRQGDHQPSSMKNECKDASERCKQDSVR